MPRPLLFAILVKSSATLLFLAAVVNLYRIKLSRPSHLVFGKCWTRMRRLQTLFMRRDGHSSWIWSYTSYCTWSPSDCPRFFRKQRCHGRFHWWIWASL